ncbi:hypothetical protein X797_012222 [Metarhizium robertsii]|uniref:Uncharacterized protein n=1 Tax=Metarhizium robertsii TaxID=568076 RepID=A0A014N4W6_9HYPO|nr:hypothetical protein X797_012222 [Metarhizium robertsii]
MAQRTFTIKAAARRARHTAEPPSPPQPGPEEAAATEHRDASGTCFLMVTPDVNCALHLRLGKKIALFSLSIITKAAAIARAADIGATQKSNGLPDSTYLWFWSSLQSFLSLCGLDTIKQKPGSQTNEKLLRAHGVEFRVQIHTQPNHITKEVDFRVTQHTG